MALLYVDTKRGGTPFNALRKSWHLLGLVVPVSLYVDLFGRLGQGATRSILIGGLAVFLGILVGADLLRFRYAGFRRLYNSLFGALLKADEHHAFNASIPYMAANLGLVIFCSPPAVMLSALFLNLGDAAASLIGLRFGRLRFWNGRSLAGTGAFVVTSIVAGWIFLWIHTASDLRPMDVFSLGTWDSPNWTPLIAVAAGAVAAAAAELFSITALRGLVDDNLWVPPAGLLGIALAYAWAGSATALFHLPGVSM